MQNALQQFHTNSYEYNRLHIATLMMNEIIQRTYPDRYFSVEDTYFDYGQDWKYTTIIAHNPSAGSVLSSYQALTPKNQEQILFGPLADLPALCEKIVSK